MLRHAHLTSSPLAASALALALALSPTAAGAAPAVQPPQGARPLPVRERLNIDADWRFALGDAKDPAHDFGYGASAFFFAKAGYGDGPASPKFDDRAWRELDLPHDWAVETPFDRRGDTNHGSKAVGPGFPQHDIGWYRKTLLIPASDQGRRISVEFDGVFRDAVVWFNGHYIGEAHSGYSSFRYDLTDYVNYGGPNVLVVRVNASVEEGWFYEGAGIYRHVWLTKTDPLHVGAWGTFVTSKLEGAQAVVTARAKIDNQGGEVRRFTVDQEVLDAAGDRLALVQGAPQELAAGASADYATNLTLAHPHLWSIETPYLYRLVTTVRENGLTRDRYETAFGVRDIRWDANTGFWLNGQNIKIKGVNIHQDYAGVGVAAPDALRDWRIGRLKAMGANAIRTSHNPPAPELLDAADRLGLLVLDEHRMMGTTPEISDELARMVERDRNHPSVVLWSVGNEEWAIEGNELGARLTRLMQAEVKALDPTRPSTVASSGGDFHGSSSASDVAGFNYRSQHDVDGFHSAYPDKPSVMTEEGSTFATRGVYVDDPAHQHIAAHDREANPGHSSSIEEGWQFVVQRPWLAGMFVWTGFDYRGETTPFGWPAISSQFGMLDTTGLFKDSAYYLKSWWTTAPMAHIVGSWTWPDRLGQTVPIWVYSNAEEVELLLNGESLGRKPMPRNGHLEWQVAYAPGALEARGYHDSRVIATDRLETAGPERAVRLQADRSDLRPDGQDVAVVTVSIADDKGRVVPTASNSVQFQLTGPGHIIGVGNGDPSSHEPDRFVDSIKVDRVTDWALADLDPGPTGLPSDLAALNWRDPFQWFPPGAGPKTPEAFLLRGRWRPQSDAGRRTLFLPKLAAGQRVFVGGQELKTLADDGSGQTATLGDTPANGEVDVVILISSGGPAALGKLKSLNGVDIGSVQTLTPAAPWRRSVFNGYAQVLVQSDRTPGTLTLTATATALAPAKVVIRTERAPGSPPPIDQQQGAGERPTRDPG
jgi:beta-galactosidase